MSLLQNLPFKEYKKLQELTKEQCEVLAKLAEIKLSLLDSDSDKKPGEILIKLLDRYGYTFEQYNQLLTKASSVKTVNTYYKPQAKVAILIANSDYQHLSKLATPYMDCRSLANHLKNLGFVVIIIKDITKSVFRNINRDISKEIPEDAYCLIVYAGHGCELLSVKCALTVDCPEEDISREHFISESLILASYCERNPELVVFIMDMCRLVLNVDDNPDVKSVLTQIMPLPPVKNFLASYSTQSDHSAYEMVQLAFTHTINSNLTYLRKTGDTSKIVPGTSLYVNALITRIEDNLDVSLLLDKVHEDVELGKKEQKPMKVQCGVAKHSLYDQAQGDTIGLITRLRKVCTKYKECAVF